MTDHLLVSLAGQSHLRAGKANQDAAAFLSVRPRAATRPMLAGSAATYMPDSELVASVLAGPKRATSAYSILAVSDGHGSASYDRSDRGSAIAVWLLLQAGITAAERLHSGASSTVDACSIELPRRIAQQWKRLVLADAALSEEPQGERGYPEPAATARRYGATTVGALLSDRGSVFWQLGDGDLVMVDAAGTVARPTGDAEPNLGTETESLCQESAETAFRVEVQLGVSHTDSLVFVATDGVANSFVDDDGFDEFVRSIAERSRAENRDVLPAYVVRWLARCSSYSGDDVSVAAQLPAAHNGSSERKGK